MSELAKLILADGDQTTYVKENAPIVLRERLQSYELAQSLFARIEDRRELEMNVRYQKEYEEEKLKLEQIKLLLSQPYNPESELPSYSFPDESILSDSECFSNIISIDSIETQLQSAFFSFGFPIQSIETVENTFYAFSTITLEQQSHLPRIRSKTEEIESTLFPNSRLIIPIPGTTKIGFELPLNSKPCHLKRLVCSDDFRNKSLPLLMGLSSHEGIFIRDLRDLGCLLVIGKDSKRISDSLQSILLGLLFHVHPSRLKLVILETDFRTYSLWGDIENTYLAQSPSLSHSLACGIDDCICILDSISSEIEMRQSLIDEAAVSDINSYNELFCQRKLPTDKPKSIIGETRIYHHYLPDIIVVLDKVNEVISSSDSKRIKILQQLANRAKVLGIYLIVTSENVSRKHIFSDFLSYFPNRLLLKLNERDSLTILKSNDASRLLDENDAIFTDGFKSTRIRVPNLLKDDFTKVFNHIKRQPTFAIPYTLFNKNDQTAVVDLLLLDPLFSDVAKLIVLTGQSSTSMIQRKFQIGYNRAGRLLDQLEAAGIVGPYNGSKDRAVLVDNEMELNAILEDLTIR